MTRITALASLGLLLIGCGPAALEGRSRVSLQLPERVQCAAAPADIRAELWVSGMSRSCSLDVSSAGAVSGDCPNITARIDRTATLDYYLHDATAPGHDADTPFRLLLAQAVRSVALESPESETVSVSFEDADFVASADCRDMTRIDDETGEGASTLDTFATDGTPCDVDADGTGNLEELCASPATSPYP